MTFTGVRPQWSFTVCEVNYQQNTSDRPVRKAIGVLEPSDEVTITTELNRPGHLELPVNIKSLSPYLKEAFTDLGAPPLEIVVSAPSGALVFAGPIVGFDVESRSRVTLDAKSMLHYLDMMKLHYPIPWNPTIAASGFTMAQLCASLINRGQLVGVTRSDNSDYTLVYDDLFDKYSNHGIRARTDGGPSYTITPGVGDEPVLDPRDGRTVLDIITDYSERGPRYGFDFEIRYESRSGDVPDTADWWFRLGNNGEHSNQIGEDISHRMVLKDEYLLNRIGSTTSLLPENFCTAVYATGGGSSADSVGILRDDNTYEPNLDDGRPWYYAVADDDVLEKSGLRFHQITSSTTIEAGEDGAEITDDTRIPQSLQTIAEAYLEPRTEKYLIPSDVDIEVDTNSVVWNNPVDRGFIAAYGTMDVGDTITVDLQTGFGRGVAPKARISKKTVKVGSRVRMQLEFL